MVWIIRVRGTFIPVRGLQFPDPDVAEADGIAVVLQHDRSIAVCGVGGMFEESRAFDRGVVLDQNAVLQDVIRAADSSEPSALKRGAV